MRVDPGEAASADGVWSTAPAEAQTESLAPPAPGADAVPATELRPGMVVGGKYRIVRELGAGGMGVVYEAVQAKLRRVVALKVPSASKLSATASARLFREARVAAAIDPARTARVYDVGSLADGTPFLVLEKLDGENAAQRLAREGPLDVVEAVDLVAEACLGLAEAHRRGIVHRDIKPSNIFLAVDAEGRRSVRVLDFGVASPEEADAESTTDASLTRTGATLGSPPYMAPEQLRTAHDVDARADVWALAVTLHELLTGELPFPGSGAALVAAIAADAPRTTRSAGVRVAPNLDHVLSRCLSKNPANRPADATALARELAPFASAPLRNQLHEQLGGPAPGGWRRPAKVALLTAGALVSAAAATFALKGVGDVTAASGETPVAHEETSSAPPPRPPPPAEGSDDARTSARPATTPDPATRSSTAAVEHAVKAPPSGDQPPKHRPLRRRPAPEPVTAPDVPVAPSLLDEREF